MSIQIDKSWIFSETGVEMPKEFHHKATDIISKIATLSDDPKSVFEEIKIVFGSNQTSSCLDFAETDCNTAMYSRIDNAPYYLHSLYVGIERLRKQTEVPNDLDDFLNKQLSDCNAPVEIIDGKIVLSSDDSTLEDAETDIDEPESSQLRYKIEEEIGRGAFGKVYRATRETSIGAFEYALKVLNPSKFIDRPDKALQRFERELKVLTRLRHKGVVSYFDAGKERDNLPFIVMELIEGVDLRKHLSGKPAKEVRRVFIEILIALSYVHSQGVLHRDIKPSNIRVRDSDKQPIILDFGCAFFEDDSTKLSITSQEVGSFAYIPPEVIANPKLRTEKQDIFALGVVLYECVANYLPNRDSLESLSIINAEYGVFDEVVKAALAPADARITNADSFISMLSELDI